ncbi:MAG: UDP-glucose/GDP-mannose dehydrogenase family protein [Deltaproteobacteria bacterium]|nr:UDP-glucose/GDP-mannose dehydrogenase family protein [Deltaproteobacteria bacterium]
MKLAVIGTGYVGLVTGAGFADMGNDVTCADIDEAKIAALRAGRIPIHEPGLDNIVAYNVSEERLSFTTDIAAAVQGAEVVFIAVGTPPGEDGSADLSHVLAAAAAVGRALRDYTVVVNKSTVPVGTAERVRRAIAAETKVPFTVASNPEFLKEGDAINDFMKPDRIVIGCDDPRARDVLRRLYEPFTRTSDRIIYMDTASAELTKYASNAMLATRISFMNDIARLCERLGADVELVRKGMGADPRIGPKFLVPGTGYGGSCFPKDVKALMATAREAGHGLELLEAVHRVNERQKQILVDKLLGHYQEASGAKGRRIAIWGLAFKPGTDDMREAPALVIIERLLAAGMTVALHDPVALEVARKLLGERAGVSWHQHPYDACAGADALVLVTEWHQFRRPNFGRIKSLLKAPLLFDGRNVWDPGQVRALGFTYYGIGRP